MTRIWDGEDFGLLSSGAHCNVLDAETLRAPVKSFSLKRDADHRIILTTISEYATPAQPQVVSRHDFVGEGTVLIEGPMGAVSLEGVIPFLDTVSYHDDNRITRHEQTSFVHTIDSKSSLPHETHFVLEWINNFELSMLPHPLDTKDSNVSKLIFPGRKGPVELESGTDRQGGTRCMRLNFGAHEIFVSEIPDREQRSPKREAFILYQSDVSEDFRRKVRDCLAFLIGRPLIYLGYRRLSQDSIGLGFRAVSGHHEDHALYNYVGLPPAPLFSGTFIMPDEKITSRLFSALFDNYDALDFLHVSWLYWRGLCSSIHSQPVQIGAAIEALQKRYLERNPKAYQTQLLTPQHYKALHEGFVQLVDGLPIGDSEKAELKRKTSILNSPSQKVLNERFFAALGLRMGQEEQDAWLRRNNAAHGEGTTDYVGLIKDVRLLTNMFCRIVLHISGGSDKYIDTFTKGYPVRSLSDPVSTPQHHGFTQPIA